MRDPNLYLRAFQPDPSHLPAQKNSPLLIAFIRCHHNASNFLQMPGLHRQDQVVNIRNLQPSTKFHGSAQAYSRQKLKRFGSGQQPRVFQHAQRTRQTIDQHQRQFTQKPRARVTLLPYDFGADTLDPVDYQRLINPQRVHIGYLENLSSRPGAFATNPAHEQAQTF